MEIKSGIKPESKPGRGGKRPGAGRKPKTAASEPTAQPQPQPQPQTRLSRSDMALMRHALAEGWRVPDELLTEALYQLHEILAGDAGKRAKLAAARVLVQMTRVDLAAGKIAGPAALPAETKALREFLDDDPDLPQPDSRDDRPGAPAPGEGPGPGARSDPA